MAATERRLRAHSHLGLTSGLLEGCSPLVVCWCAAGGANGALGTRVVRAGESEPSASLPSLEIPEDTCLAGCANGETEGGTEGGTEGAPWTAEPRLG